MKSYINICAAISIYVILIISYFIFGENYGDSIAKIEKFENCSFRNPCLTFCKHSDYTKLSDEVIREKFPYDDFEQMKSHYDDYDETQNKKHFEIVKEDIFCTKRVESKMFYENHEQWKIFYSGEIRLKGDDLDIYWSTTFYTHHKYCLQPYLDDAEDNLQLKLEVCDVDYSLYKRIHYLLLALTAIFLITPMCVYALFKEIRHTLHGKLCIALFATQLYIIFIMPIEDYYSNHYFRDFLPLFYFFGSFSTNFVVNLMCFDIYLSFKHFREPNYQSRYFKNFTWFLIIFFFLAAIITNFVTSRLWGINDIFPAIAGGVAVAFFLTLLMNIFALIMSFYYLIALTRSSTITDNTRLDLEKERFWLYIKLFAIMSIVWFSEINGDYYWNFYESFIIFGVIKSYSGLLAAILLLWTPRIYSLVFERYNSIKDDPESNAKSEDDA